MKGKRAWKNSMLKKTKMYINQGYRASKDAFPSLAGLADELGVAKSTITLWASDPNKEEFGYLIEQLATKQERVLINKLSTGEIKGQWVNLFLHKHGYAEKQEVQQTVSTDVNFTVEFVAPTAQPTLEKQTAGTVIEYPVSRETLNPAVSDRALNPVPSRRDD
jgi:hypothetical protein